MITTLKRIFALFTPKERFKLKLLFSAILGIAIMETAGVASVMPFMAVVSNPEIIQTNPILNWIFHVFGFSETNSFLIFLGTLALIILIINNSLAAATEWFLARFTWLGGHTIAKRLLAGYLAQPYIFFLNRNTSEMGKNILTEVVHYMKGVLRPVMNMLAKIVVSIFIFILLLVVDPILAIIVALVLGTAYSTLFFFVRKKLTRIGKERIRDNEMQFKAVTEALSGIKDIKVLGRENTFLDNFSTHSRQYAVNEAAHQVISQLPKYALEIVAFGGILIIVIYFLAIERNVTQIIPLIALYAFAGYRLMPAMQSVFVGVTNLRFNLAILDILYSDLSNAEKVLNKKANGKISKKSLPFNNKLELVDISFSYPERKEAAIKNLNLHIQAKTSVGFVGSTGSGKTTLIDLILGLLTPLSGQMVVDGRIINKQNIYKWQKNIGYVPQNIFLCDDSVVNNIALGIPPDKIDLKAVEHASKIANLHDFILKELPQGYNTIIGERGIRLSGGQKQRIGIARAMYNEPGVLILDEATSSLDGITEEAVMLAINNLAHEKTIIIIAHRLTTVKNCDEIYFMDNGSILDKGTYDELMYSCSKFRAMANQNGSNHIEVLSRT